ncbi:metallophosphoesterase family protein [Deinococcus detaillensis]|uniref:Metallophosphoesterase family protein n=1 Tax=Deinococcus detaillensis TaxID=2592048 RepID=A0A553UWS9_9DEIO|nr:metallophosphoesterase family protein [Deinococcus detaillensis]TSA84654.1 metallophosphoesterase family protein [Deinococcus detaillensis]
MRLAIFSDIHGNLPALEALLADLRTQAPDLLLCLGDVAMTGPFPNECLQAVAALGCGVVMGNADQALLEALPAFVPRGLPDEQEIYDLDAWSHAAVGDKEREWVRAYQPTLRPAPELLAFHGSPESNTEVLDAGTPQERLAQLRAEYGDAPLWIGGHTHRPLLRSLDGWTLLNPGSVGMPFELRNGHYVNLARADYLILDLVAGVFQPQFRQVPYAARRVQDGFVAAKVPHAAKWVAEWVDVR